MQDVIKENLENILSKLENTEAKLIAVTKTHPVEKLQTLYDLDFKTFGENRVQELTEKYEMLPKDIDWHLIGTLQTNKVKYIAPFAKMIHSVESFKLLKEIDKRAKQNERVIECLLQMHIADEETKFGLDEQELYEILDNEELAKLQNIKLVGLMGMATFTEDENQIRSEFKKLKSLFDKVKSNYNTENIAFRELSMGMSGDYPIAIEEGATLVRVGSAIFGSR
ncbi:YggS family pyridoxal phosphate-dependent enzyme [Bernardetia sp.]|uniref:YggS family pyridoxal phosphate-dependent enzyme n=1 Tax=Bernardetia sp. TaxID=1937974 RepID=UPI0025B83718|nr:YggS family pyridoxal phosphate-dependent enzyme [Bernardetia sp.]